MTESEIEKYRENIWKTMSSDDDKPYEDRLATKAALVIWSCTTLEQLFIAKKYMLMVIDKIGKVKRPKWDMTQAAANHLLLHFYHEQQDKLLWQRVS